MNSSERVLHILWSLDIGGAERALYQLVREQRRVGVAADVAAGSHRGYYGDRTRETGATVHELRQRWAYDPRSARRALQLFREYEILHFHAAEPALAGLASLLPARKYYTHRSGQFSYTAKQRARYWVMARIVRRTFSGVSANGQQATLAAAELFGLPVSSIALTYNGLDFRLLEQTRSAEEIRQELAIPDGAFSVATTGNLRWWKRVDLLIRAVAGAPDRIRCYVIGDGPDRRRLEELARELRVQDRVTFTGTRQSVADYLYAMDAFVLPSGPQEAFGNSAVEAMAVGLPTIVFDDSAGLLEHVEPGADGFVVSSVGELTALLVRLEEDRAFAASIGARASESVREKYTLSRMLDAYETLYAQEYLVSPRAA
jgi:L-malate glycosyltransferase